MMQPCYCSLYQNEAGDYLVMKSHHFKSAQASPHPFQMPNFCFAKGRLKSASVGHREVRWRDLISSFTWFSKNCRKQIELNFPQILI